MPATSRRAQVAHGVEPGGAFAVPAVEDGVPPVIGRDVDRVVCRRDPLPQCPHRLVAAPVDAAGQVVVDQGCLDVRIVPENENTRRADRLQLPGAFQFGEQELVLSLRDEVRPGAAVADEARRPERRSGLVRRHPPDRLDDRQQDAVPARGRQVDLWAREGQGGTRHRAFPDGRHGRPHPAGFRRHRRRGRPLARRRHEAARTGRLTA
jgi:hypothetical protein